MNKQIFSTPAILFSFLSTTFTYSQEVGIGTTVPAARLDIQAPTTYTGSLLHIQHGSNTYLVVKNNGNIGVGTANPDAQLTVTGKIMTGSATLPSGAPGAGKLVTVQGTGQIGISMTRTTSSAWSFFEAFDENGTWMFRLNEFGNMVINSGKLGIGTASPTTKLHVVGNMLQSANSYHNFGSAVGYWGYGIRDNGGIIQFKNNGGTWTNLGGSSGGSGQWTDAGTYIHANNATNVVISDAGNVGVGTTSPNYQLHLIGDGMMYAEGNYGSGDTIPAGAKTAFIWNPRKSAIRAGRVTGNQWDYINTGNFSVAFGINNTASNSSTTISGGSNNTASGSSSTVGGGSNNTASGMAAVIAGGQNNTASGERSTVGGGENNTAGGPRTTVCGGWINNASGNLATIVGGFANNASGQYSTVAGRSNTASGDYTIVAGGQSNTATGFAAAVLGGQNNTASGSYSVSMGRGMKLDFTASHTFAFGYNVSSSPPTINTSNVFLIGPNGNTYRVGINLDSPAYALELPNNTDSSIGKGRANAWLTYSDQRIKSHIRHIHYGVDAVMKLRPVEYVHHSSHFENSQLVIDKNNKEHTVGLLAQELYQVIPEAVSKPADESKSLWSVDYTRLVPVLINAIQQQQQHIQRLEHRLSELEAETKR